MTMQKEQPLKQPKHSRENVRITLNIAWPSIVESFFVAFAGLVDSLMVSSLGSYAVAAVGLTTQPKFVGLSVFFAANVAVSALVARRRGEEKPAEANRILSTAIAFILVVSVILSVLLVTFASPIIRLCGSTPETHDSAVAYFRIIMGGMIFNCIQMGINSAQRGAGNTKITMRTNVTSNTINIIFNYLLIGGHFGFPALGIHGAALATVLGTVVASVMSVLSILKPDGFISIPYILKNKIWPAARTLHNLIHVGYSVFFEQILMRIGFMMTAIMAAKQGTDAMAAHQVGMNIMGLSFSFGDGLQATAVALIGYSLGAKQPEMAKEYGRTCRMIGGVISVILSAVYLRRPGRTLLLRRRTAAGSVFRGGAYRGHRRRHYACHHLRSRLSDQPGGIHGLPARRGRHTLHSCRLHHQRHLYPHPGFLAGRLCVRPWHRRYLVGRACRPDLPFPLCIHTV